MKPYLLYLCSATLIVACSKPSQSLDTPLDNGRVNFAASISDKTDDWSRATRGAVTDGATIADFGVFCYQTDLKPWNEVSSSALPNKMDNVKVSRPANSGTDIWDYGTPVAWYGGDGSYFTFFGYSPYATATNGIVVPQLNVAGIPMLGFTVLDAVGAQVDMLVAEPVYNTVPVAKVKMQFKHVLSRIGFKAFSLVPGVRVEKIELKGIKYKADLTLNKSWNTTSDTKDFTLGYDTPIEIPVGATTEANAVDLTGVSNGFLMLPQDMTTNESAKITFTYSFENLTLTKDYIIKESWATNTFVTYMVNLTTVLEAPLVVSTVLATEWGLGSANAGDMDGQINK